MSEVAKPICACNIVPIIMKDNSTVIEFLLKRFFADEPLNAAVNLMNEKNIVETLKNHTLKLLYNGKLKQQFQTD